ncbi:unnamed protein product, partial [Musa banksii]
RKRCDTSVSCRGNRGEGVCDAGEEGAAAAAMAAAAGREEEEEDEQGRRERLRPWLRPRLQQLQR